MYCSNCGKEYNNNELYCGGCGLKINRNTSSVDKSNEIPAVETSVPNIPEMKKKKPTWLVVLLIILVTIVILGVIFIVAILALVGIFMNHDFDPIFAQTEYYVYLDGEEIPTVYNYFGEYELCDSPEINYEDELEITTFSYCDEYFDKSIMDDYLEYLVDEYDYEVYEVTSVSKSVVVDSLDEGYSLVVKVYYYGESIEYYKIKSDELLKDEDI